MRRREEDADGEREYVSGQPFLRRGDTGRQRRGGHVFTEHPGMGLTDVYAAIIPDLPFEPAVHVFYGETVLRIHDGIVKQQDVPAEMGGSGVELPE